MFESPFSFGGRIRRTEYGITFIITAAFCVLFLSDIVTDNGMVLMAALPLLWLLAAQGTKRCHDVNRTGWWQLIPFYCVLLLSKDGIIGPNQYGEDPKERVAVIRPMAVANDGTIASPQALGNIIDDQQ